MDSDGSSLGHEPTRNIGGSNRSAVNVKTVSIPARVQPIQNLEIVGATGYWLRLFGDFPDNVKWTGITIIVGSVLYIFK